jgi:4-amino-4-deoxy-L-arabinose transferase-like glycosyltransferase
MRGRLRGIPRAGWLCALVALANGFAWSLITPPFQVPDENAHYAYVQQIAERGTLPHTIAKEGALSPRQDATMAAINVFSIVGQAQNPAPFSELQQQALDRAVDQNLSARGTGDALTASDNPPLYYLLQVIPYKLTPGGKVLDRLELMRLVSVLMAAITVLLVFLFLCELLPSRPWAWTTGALLVAFQPMFAFISSGVNNDALLYLTATGVLWAIARAFRRGLDVDGGVAIGAFLGFGLVTKLTLLAFVPAAVVALALLLRRSWRSPSARITAMRGVLVAVVLSAAPIGIYELFTRLVLNRGAIPLAVVNVPASAVVHKYDFREELSHIWQLFLPTLGHMRHQFTYLPLWETWFKGLVGHFGWLDYGFPEWTYWSVLAVAGVLVLLALAELTRCRRTLVRRLDELVVYILALAGLCGEIGVESYRLYIENGAQFEQARYLLPVIGLYAAIGALAVRFGGRRFGPALAGALIVLALGHDLFAQAISIARYYT